MGSVLLSILALCGGNGVDGSWKEIGQQTRSWQTQSTASQNQQGHPSFHDVKRVSRLSKRIAAVAMTLPARSGPLPGAE